MCTLYSGTSVHVAVVMWAIIGVWDYSTSHVPSHTNAAGHNYCVVGVHDERDMDTKEGNGQ